MPSAIPVWIAETKTGLTAEQIEALGVERLTFEGVDQDGRAIKTVAYDLDELNRALSAE